MKRAVCVNRGVRKPRRAVTSDSAAAETLHAKHDVLANRKACAHASTASVFGSVVGSQSRGSADSQSVATYCARHLRAGENAVTEAVEQCEYFVVSETRIEGDLGDNIGGRIERVRGSGVIAVACAIFAEQIVAGIVVRSKRSLGGFHRDREGNFVAEALGHAESVLSSKYEANVVIRIDGLRPGVVASTQVIIGRNSLPVLRYQAPCLAAEEAPAVVRFGLSPCLAQTEGVAVGLRGGGGNTGREEVG